LLGWIHAILNINIVTELEPDAAISGTNTDFPGAESGAGAAFGRKEQLVAIPGQRDQETVFGRSSLESTIDSVSPSISRSCNYTVNDSSSAVSTTAEQTTENARSNRLSLSSLPPPDNDSILIAGNIISYLYAYCFYYFLLFNFSCFQLKIFIICMSCFYLISPPFLLFLIKACLHNYIVKNSVISTDHCIPCQSMIFFYKKFSIAKKTIQKFGNLKKFCQAHAGLGKNLYHKEIGNLFYYFSLFS